MEKENIGANIIVDLYEMRANFLPPVTGGDYQARMTATENLAKYNFFNVVIGRICDKYKISDRDIDEAIRDRRINGVQPRCES